jgi:hypothetical protein
MRFTSPQHHSAEWPLLILALALVGGICAPLWQWGIASEQASLAISWDRLSRMVLGAEQVACYACFTWASLILVSRWLGVRRQRRAFTLGLLPWEEGLRILPEDARTLQRRVEQLSGHRAPSLLSHLLYLALGRFAISRSPNDAGEIVRTQADLELGRMANSMSTIHYLAWAIPALGFVGTVRHIGLALGAASDIGEEALPGFLGGTTRYLAVAFDTTLVALLLSLILMFLLHFVQREQESVVLDCQQYCLENLISRLYDSSHEFAVLQESVAAAFGTEKPWS